MAVMSRYPDGYFDLACCDVPYGIGAGKMSYVSERQSTVKQKNGNRLSPYTSKKRYPKSNWDSAPPPQQYFDELRRVAKHQIVFGADYAQWSGMGKGRIKWNKGFGEGLSFKKYEVAYCSMLDCEIELPLLWAGLCQAKSLSEPMTQQGNKRLNERRIHPCHKPVLLYMKLYMDFGFPGMRVLDTHLGGGSSRIAAEIFGCDFTGCEIDSYFYEQHLKRWDTYIRQQKLQFT